MDIRLALMSGIDIPIENCQLIAHQPRIKEIAFLGEKKFNMGLQTLCINKNMISEDKLVLQNINNFQIFMKVMTEKHKELKEKQCAVKEICTLFFPNLKVSFTPYSMMFLGGEQPIIIDENNFETLQETINSICCLRSGPGGSQDFNPADDKAREIAAKLMRGRQRVAAQKGENHSSILSQYVSTLTVGIHSMSLSDCLNLTLYQLYDLVERYMLYINWDMDIKARLAGAKSEKPLENWMKDIH